MNFRLIFGKFGRVPTIEPGRPDSRRGFAAGSVRMLRPSGTPRLSRAQADRKQISTGLGHDGLALAGTPANSYHCSGASVQQDMDTKPVNANCLWNARCLIALARATLIVVLAFAVRAPEVLAEPHEINLAAVSPGAVSPGPE